MPEFPQSGLTAKGTGLPDFQLGVQSVTGSVQVGSIKVVAYINRIGTLATGGGGGTIKSILAGSLGYIKRLGTIQRVVLVGTLGRLTSVGTIRNVVAGQDILTGVDVQARLLSGTAMRDRIPLGQGSTWTGSWQSIANYRKKTYVFRPIGTPGSFAAIVGLTGTGVGGGTGTIYLRRIAQGSYGTYSFEDAFSFTRPWFRRGGGGRGTVTVMFARQA